MGSENHQRSGQQYRHKPEGIEQNRIFSPIMMCRVCQVPGELTMRTFMTFAAGCYNVLVRKSRSGIVYVINIVRSMTIITFSRRVKTEFGYFAMERFEVRFGNLLMAATALIQYRASESGLIGSDDGVGIVTIDAFGKELIGLVRIG